MPVLNRIACRWTPLFVRTTTSLTWPRLPADVRDAFAAPVRHRRPAAPAVGDFVADIPFAAGHPSRPALDRIADGIAGLDVPALLLWGPRDPVFLEEHLRDLQDRLPQAELHRYERASHLLPEDAPGYADAGRRLGRPAGCHEPVAPPQRRRSRTARRWRPAGGTGRARSAARATTTALTRRGRGRAAGASAGPSCTRGSGTPPPAWPRPASGPATGSRCWSRRRST